MTRASGLLNSRVPWAIRRRFIVVVFVELVRLRAHGRDALAQRAPQQLDDLLGLDVEHGVALAPVVEPIRQPERRGALVVAPRSRPTSVSAGVAYCR